MKVKNSNSYFEQYEQDFEQDAKCFYSNHSMYFNIFRFIRNDFFNSLVGSNSFIPAAHKS